MEFVDIGNFFIRTKKNSWKRGWTKIASC